MHEDLHRDETTRSLSNRAFGAAFAVVFAVIGVWPLVWGDSPRVWSLALSAVLAAVAVLAPKLLALPNRGWTHLTRKLGAIIGAVVLALVFAVLLVPTGLLMRLFGKDPLRRKREPEAPSYWIPRPPELRADPFKDQF